MKFRNQQLAGRRSRAWSTRGVVLVALGCLVLSACADDPSDASSDGSSSAPATLVVSEEGEFAGLITSTELTEPTVDGDQVTIDAGGQEVTVEKDQELSVGLFVSGGATPFFQTTNAWAEAQAEAYGWDLEMVDAAFDAGKQADQIQTAISTEKYDAILVVPVDGVGSCDAFTKQAPAAGILVVSIINPLCGRDTEPIESQDVPGTLGVVGGSTSAVTWQAFHEQVVSEFPEGKGLSVALSESICVCAIGWNQALDGAESEYPGVDLTRAETPSPDAAGGFAVTEQYLNDNPDAEFIIALSDEMGSGAAEAVEAAGLTGKVKVYMSGGTELILGLMEDGAAHGTHPYYNGTVAQTALLMLHEAVAGNPVPRVIANDGHELESFSAEEPPFFTYVAPDNLDAGYTPDTIENAQAR